MSLGTFCCEALSLPIVILDRGTSYGKIKVAIKPFYLAVISYFAEKIPRLPSEP